MVHHDLLTQQAKNRNARPAQDFGLFLRAGKV
jgi:hypothetical protein